ncbi:MAG: 30S ribosomal protein S6--L-glutamate ligase [Cyanobacteria bacterium J06642_3]
MKIAILSQNANLYSTRRLREAGRKQGHDMRVINYLRCYLKITCNKPAIVYRGNLLENFDAIIPRIGASKTFYGTAVVRQFEVMDVYSPNQSQAISCSRDKLHSMQILAKEGVSLPVTAFAHVTHDIDSLIDLVGGLPLVIKLLKGSQGIGIVLTETYQAAKSVVEAFRDLNANILVQEFIQEAKGIDLRCFVVGEEVIAAMKRQVVKREFRFQQPQRGGDAQKVALSLEEMNTAIRAAKAIGLKVAAVDLLRWDHGLAVMEVRSSPDLAGIERATGVDVAGKIISFIAKNALSADNSDYPSKQLGDRRIHTSLSWSP